MHFLAQPELWFVCGSQHLYGPGPLATVADNARQVAAGLNDADSIPLKVVFKALLTTPDEVTRLMQEANATESCAGLILWMHTFSPAKMWIRGLSQLRRPVLHLHTQFNRDLPWGKIDMDFMNLNQAAHGDREAGFLHARLRLKRKVVVGHWSDPEVRTRIGAWARAAHAWHDWQGARFARFGDNMRNVAVTEGDKVSAEMTFGFSTNGYGIGELVRAMDSVADDAVAAQCDTYERSYNVDTSLRRGGERHGILRDAARQELGLRRFLTDGGFKGFTTTFEDLHGLQQLPGLACQRLMANGFGFGAEGDWKTAALLRAMKVMGHGLSGGTSFMEDYTYHLSPAGHLVLGAHMLEICPTIAAGKPSLQVHPLGIGGKGDPARLVFDAPAGKALNSSLVDLGNRFRLITNEVEAVGHPALPKLPVARAVWRCQPDFKTACGAWILAGGAHHTGYSYAVTTEMLEDFSTMAGIEHVVIDAETRLGELKSQLRSNEVAYLAQGLGHGA